MRLPGWLRPRPARPPALRPAGPLRPAVLQFGYAGFSAFARDHAATGRVSVNLGDYMQTLAARAAWARLGADPDAIVAIDRDALPAYDGPPVALIMNACFYRHCFPLPPQVWPVFFGFQAKRKHIRRVRRFLQAHAPIGCRDPATAAHCAAEGIAARVTGCLTMSFDPRPTAPDPGAVLLVHGAGAGAFPEAALDMLPPDMAARLVRVSQRRDVTRLPLPREDRDALEAAAAALLARYRREAGHVITPLHHAAAPCLSSGIPVTICRAEPSDRFGWLERLVPVHVAPDFSAIDWAAPLPDLAPVRDRQRDTLAAMVADLPLAL